MRGAILDAAHRRFVRFGPRKTTMDEVAREANCSRATLYTHFTSKEVLYASLLERGAEEFINEAEEVARSDWRAGKKIRRIVELTRAIYARNHVLRLALVRDDEMTLEAIAHGFTRDQERRIIDILTRVLDEGMTEGTIRRIDSERVAYLMFHLGRFLVERETSGARDYPFDEIIGLMDEVFARGIAEPRQQSG
ncbi:MAG: TetR/AcrR family transcriptional regulator [Deltaproteobacteria bacterium]|nr:TetR/AcrR family transcriptional regulator [Deltaproteobacteria bacterium]